MILLSSFYKILYIVMAIFGILALGGLTGRDKEEKRRKLPYKNVDIKYLQQPEPQMSDAFTTYVGGARFYTDTEDLRCFAGFVYYDPEEEAPIVYRNDMRMLGHVPRERLIEYSNWSRRAICPCFGYIMRGNNAEELITELRIVKPYNEEYVEREIRNYVGWVTMTHGNGVNIYPEKFVPLLPEQEIVKLQKERKRRDNGR